MVVNVGHLLLFHVRQGQDGDGEEHEEGMEYVSDAYYEWRDRVTRAEMGVLRALSFDVQPVILPTSLLASYLSALELQECECIAQACMNYVNDAGGGWTYAKYSLPLIICACIQMAVDACSEPRIVLPDEWYGVFDVDEGIEGVMREMECIHSVTLDCTLPLTEEETRVFVGEGAGGNTATIPVHHPLKRSRWDQQHQ